MMFSKVVGFFKLAKQFGTMKVINKESAATFDKVKIAISIK